MRPNVIDLTGNRYGRLVVLSYCPRKMAQNRSVPYWECKCDCGNIKTIKSASLKNGRTISCGCYNIEKSTKHNASFSKEYSTWQHMKRRALGKQKEVEQYYKNKGIEDRWLNDFNEFIKDMGHAPSSKHSIDRIDVNKGYFKDNCRWATPKEQNRNQTTTRFVEFKGQTRSIAEWADITGIDRHNIYYRLDNGWSVEDALTRGKYGLCKTRNPV